MEMRVEVSGVLVGAALLHFRTKAMMIRLENIVVDVGGNIQRKASNRAPVHTIPYRPDGYRTIRIRVKGKEIHSAVLSIGYKRVQAIKYSD
jgi:hypothetical protein